MDTPNHDFKMPSEEDIRMMGDYLKKLGEYIISLRQELEEANRESEQNIEIQPDIHTEIPKNGRPKIRLFQPRPVNKQMIIQQRLLQAKVLLTQYKDILDNLMLITNNKAMEYATIVHESLREASKTDPSLLGIVAEMDELLRQAEEEEREEEAPE